MEKLHVPKRIVPVTHGGEEKRLPGVYNLGSARNILRTRTGKNLLTSKRKLNSRSIMSKDMLVRLVILLALLAVICVPSVFTAVVNALAATANWVSRQVGVDWHSISSSYNPELDVFHRPTPHTHWSVWLVLSLTILDVLALTLAPLIWKKAQKATRFAIQLLVEANLGLVCLLIIALTIRLHQWF